MPSKQEMRRELWDYLEEQGIKITVAQHNKIREILEKYVFAAAEITKQDFKSALGELEVRRKGFNAWRKERAARNKAKAEQKKQAQVN